MNWLFYQGFGAIILLVFFIYKYIISCYSYWKLRGIQTAKGFIPIFGHTFDLIKLTKNTGTILHDIYSTHSQSMIGIYFLQKPVLLVRNPDLVKIILQKEFSSFGNHITIDEHADYLLAVDPFFINGQKWKETRGYYTSAFSAKRLKFLSLIIKRESEKLIKFIDEQLEKKYLNEFDAKRLFSRYTSGVATSTIFGVESDEFSDPISSKSFIPMMDAMFIPRISNAIRQNLVFFIPLLNKFIKTGFAPMWVNKSFEETVKSIRMIRKKEQAIDDVILQHIEDYQTKHDSNHDHVANHSFSFFVETYETSSLVLSFTAYLLSKHPSIQEKVRNEVMEVLAIHQEISYDSINDMQYLDQVIKESLRLYTPVAVMRKICTKDTTLQGPDGLTCKLNSGDEIYISPAGLHRDPLFWNNPDEFIPERFDKNSEENESNNLFLGFGEGPRICPGMRMGLLQIKIAIAAILRNFSIDYSSKMKEPIEIDPKYFLSSIKNGFWVRFKHLEK